MTNSQLLDTKLYNWMLRNPFASDDEIKAIECYFKREIILEKYAKDACKVAADQRNIYGLNS